MTDMKSLHERRTIALDQARESLERFLSSPNADDVCEYLMTVLRVEPIMRETPERTAYQLGMFDAIRELKNIQKQAKGDFL